VAEQEARAAADAVSDNKPFRVRSWTGVCLACAPPAPTGPQAAPEQAEPEASLELKFFGEAGESGVGVVTIPDWSALSPPQQEAVRAWLRDADWQYGMGAAGPRQPVSGSMRQTGNEVTRVARVGLRLGGTSVSGHVPDMAGGGDPIGVQIGLPPRVNSSIGGQWKRYKPGFRFTGLSGVDESTGRWIYQSDALEHELPPIAPGKPVRTAPSTSQATAPAEVPPFGGSQTTAETAASEGQTIALTEDTPAAAPGVVSPEVTPAAATESLPDAAVVVSPGATPTPAVKPVDATGGAVTHLVTLGLLLVIDHLSKEIAENTRESIRYGWRTQVAPEVEKTIRSIHRGWRRYPKTKPTQQTYLVVVYGITFEYQPHSKWLPGGPVYLYEHTDFLRSHISTTPLNARLIPPDDRVDNFATRQVFAVSIPLLNWFGLFVPSDT
jgi:hypothetical protein